MIGIALGLAVLVGAGLGWSGVVLVTGFVCIAYLMVSHVPIWTILLIACAVLGSLRVHEWRQEPQLSWSFKPEVISGEVVSGPVENGRVQRFDLLGVPLDSVGNVEAVHICVTAPVVPRAFRGDRISISGELSWFDEIEPQFRAYLISRGCRASLFGTSMAVVNQGEGVWSSLDHTRRNLVDVILRAAPGDAGALIAGLVTGDDAALLPQTHDAFVITGTSHVTAVSGSNLALIVTMLTILGMAAGLVRKWYWQVLIVALLWSYVGLIGPSPPPIRAAGVATFAVIAVRLGRKPDFITLSVIVAAIEVLWRPEDFATLAFRLSTVSSIALVLGLSGISPHGWKGWLRHGIIATAITQVATSALLIPAFGRFSLVSVPANLVIGPLCAIAFPLGLVGGFLGLESQLAGSAVIAVAAVPATLAVDAVTLFARVPGAGTTSDELQRIPMVSIAIVSLVLVSVMSRECRGGIRRSARAVGSLDFRSRAILAGAATGTVIGLLPGLILR